MKLYPNGSWHCFGCNRGGSSIDLAAALYGLTPLDAVRRLDADFSLHLPIDRQQTTEERRSAAQMAQRRREVQQTFRRFERWRADMLQKLTACFREGHLALQSLETPEDFDRLTKVQALAIREQTRFEWLADVLTSGTMAEQMQIFRERRDILRRIEQILNRSPRKFGAA